MVWCTPRLLKNIHLARLRTISASNDSPLIRVDSLWNAIDKETLPHQGVLASWSHVGTATVKFMNMSVSTKTFSLPSEVGSICVKSMASTSNGLVVWMLIIGVLTGRCGPLAHILTHTSSQSTSSVLTPATPYSQRPDGHTGNPFKTSLCRLVGTGWHPCYSHWFSNCIVL